jgi:hypothetical protein
MSKQQIHTVYKLEDGTRVPSVTTYLGVLNKPALIHWAWELGVQGLDYRKVRDAAGDTGTLVHYLILCDLKNMEPDLRDYSQTDITSTTVPMGKYFEWKADHEVKPIVLETPMVSETYRFGGTPDFYGEVDGVLTLLDFKTSGAVYAENFYQLSAYWKLLEEHGEKPESAGILRIGKTLDEGFEYRAAGKLDVHWDIFCACQEIYELQKKLRRTKKDE